MIPRTVLAARHQCRLASLSSGLILAPRLYPLNRSLTMFHRFLSSESGLPVLSQATIQGEKDDSSTSTSTEESEDGYLSRSTSSSSSSSSSSISLTSSSEDPMEIDEEDKMQRAKWEPFQADEVIETKKFLWIRIDNVPPEILTKEIEYTLKEIGLNHQAVRSMLRDDTRIVVLPEVLAAFATSEEREDALRKIRTQQLFFGPSRVSALKLANPPSLGLTAKPQFSLIVRNYPLSAASTSPLLKLYDYLPSRMFSPFFPDERSSRYYLRLNKRKKLLKQNPDADTFVIMKFPSEVERSIVLATKPQVEFQGRTLTLDLID